MVGNIRRPNPVIPFDLSLYFDNTTHTATEENFLAFLNKGVYIQDVIGYYVTLSNTVEYNGGKWIIADVNHDSENTGQTGCYDLISVDVLPLTFTYVAQSSISTYTNYFRDAYLRRWLNDTFYPGFSSSFKTRMVNIKYVSNGSMYDDDKVIIPSFTEVNGNVPTDFSSVSLVEGVKYPVFDAGSSSRIKYYFGYSGSAYARTWWTRSRYTGTGKKVWAISTGGTASNPNCDSSTENYIAPLLRVM